MAYNMSKVSMEKTQFGFFHTNFSRSSLSFMSNSYDNGWMGRFENLELVPGLKIYWVLGCLLYTSDAADEL